MCVLSILPLCCWWDGIRTLIEPYRPLLVSLAAEEDAERSTARACSAPVPVAAANSLWDVRDCSVFLSPR